MKTKTRSGFVLLIYIAFVFYTVLRIIKLSPYSENVFKDIYEFLGINNTQSMVAPFLLQVLLVFCLVILLHIIVTNFGKKLKPYVELIIVGLVSMVLVGVLILLNFNLNAGDEYVLAWLPNLIALFGSLGFCYLIRCIKWRRSQ